MARKKKKLVDAPEPATCSYPRRRSVDIEEAKNGHVVSGHDEQGNRHLFVSKSKKERDHHVKKVLALGRDKGVEKEMKKAREKMTT